MAESPTPRPSSRYLTLNLGLIGLCAAWVLYDTLAAATGHLGGGMRAGHFLANLVGLFIIIHRGLALLVRYFPVPAPRRFVTLARLALALVIAPQLAVQIEGLARNGHLGNVKAIAAAVAAHLQAAAGDAPVTPTDLEGLRLPRRAGYLESLTVSPDGEAFRLEARFPAIDADGHTAIYDSRGQNWTVYHNDAGPPADAPEPDAGPRGIRCTPNGARSLVCNRE